MIYLILSIATLAINVSTLWNPQIIYEPPFRIEYSPESEKYVEYTLEILKSASAEFGDILPIGNNPIRVILCGTPLQFRLHGGAWALPDINGLAKVDEGIIVVKTPSLLKKPGEFPYVVRHELVHILLARNSDEAHVPLWLNEGIAMILSGEKRWNSLSRVIHMYLTGQILPYWELEMMLQQPGIETVFNDAYAQSLLMTRYLMKRVGKENFWQMIYELNTMTFGDALRKRLGLSPLEFYNAWIRSFWQFALIGLLVSGLGLFQMGAILVIFAYIRLRHVFQQRIKLWEMEEQDNNNSETS